MNNKSKGQALLLVLLSVGVVLTIAMSVVARSITDVSVTTKDEESLRAFSAAEAGVEETLKQPVASLQIGASPSPVTVSPNANYLASLTSFPENRREYLYPSELLSGDIATVWLASHNPDNSLVCTGGNICFTGSTVDICWGKTGVSVSEQPAVAISILYEDPAGGGVLKYAHTAFDPNSSRASQNSFSTSLLTNTSTGACAIGATALANRASIDLLNDLSIPNGSINGRRLKSLTATLLYNSSPTPFGVANLTSDLPNQGVRVDSTGVAGTASRKVQVYSLYPEIPSIFQAAIYSPPGIVK